jgi:hypothetical protein
MRRAAGRKRLSCRRQCGGAGRKTGGMRMDGGSRYLILAAVAAVLVVLLLGLWNMLRGTSPNLSQTLMRWRVGLQFLAIVIMMLLVYLSGRS